MHAERRLPSGTTSMHPRSSLLAEEARWAIERHSGAVTCNVLPNFRCISGRARLGRSGVVLFLGGSCRTRNFLHTRDRLSIHPYTYIPPSLRLSYIDTTTLICHSIIVQTLIATRYIRYITVDHIDIDATPTPDPQLLRVETISSADETKHCYLGLIAGFDIATSLINIRRRSASRPHLSPTSQTVGCIVALVTTRLHSICSVRSARHHYLLSPLNI